MKEIFHSAEQPTFYELREEFRRTNHERVLSSLHPQEYKVGPLIYRFLTDQKASPVDVTLSDQGDIIAGEQSVGLDDVPCHLVKMLIDKAEEIETFEAMTLPLGEGTDHDGPACKLVDSMTEAEQISYVEYAIQKSKEKDDYVPDE